jgi:hypothetical protein
MGAGQQRRAGQGFRTDPHRRPRRGHDISDADLRRLRTVANNLAEITDRARLGAQIQRRLLDLVDADLVVDHEFDADAFVCRLRYWPSADAGVGMLAGEHARLLTDHPLVAGNLAGALAVPSRVSDHIDLRTWTRTTVYHEIVKPVGALHQIALPLDTVDPSRMHGISLNRARIDFTDRDVDLFAVAQPTFAVIERRLVALDRLSPAADHAGGLLTRRERAVLKLLASGLTTVAIARAMAIRPATAHKHIEPTPNSWCTTG